MNIRLILYFGFIFDFDIMLFFVLCFHKTWLRSPGVYMLARQSHLEELGAQRTE